MTVRKPFGKGIPSDRLRISLCDTNPRVVDPWLWAFRDSEDVEVLEGSVLDLDCDAILSPANSFGDMSGGVDKAIDDFYNGQGQESAIAAIREEFCGELPVGHALVVRVPGAKRFPYLIVSPTMRTPTNVAESLNAYLAFRGALVAVRNHNRQNSAEAQIRSLAVPGLCTGVGGMDPGHAAEQMIAAHRNVILGYWEKVVHPAMAPFPFGPREARDKR